ncbi:hypothetical protein FOA52_002719 [Chlamydomonas sp. UWO 241]|nr:hypothetical protein FOA52_002719 [Chlamydomonas sp. UWO 241]
MADAPGICMAPLLSSRQAFTAAYKEFCDSTGTKYRDEYPMHGTHFTVFELWRAIQDRGGFTQVSASKAWGATARSFLPAEALADRQWESVASDIKRTYAQRLKLCTLEEQMRGQEQQQQEQQQSQQQQQGNIADADATAHAATPIGTPGGTIGADGALLSVDAALSGPGRTTDTVMRDALGAGIAAEGGTEGASEGDSRSSSESEEVHSGGEGPAGLACMCTRAGTAIGLSATFAWKRKREPASGSGEVDSCAENNDVAASGAAAADVTDTDNDTPRTKKLGCQHGHAPGVQQDSRAPQLPQQQQQEQQQQQTPGSAAAPPTASSIGSAEQRTGATTPRGAELDPVAAAAGTIAAKPAPNSWLTADTAGADAESDVAAAAAALLQASEAAAACWPSALRGGPGSGGKKPGGHGQPPGARPVPRGHPRSLPQMMLKQRMPAGAAAPPSASKAMVPKRRVKDSDELVGARVHIPGSEFYGAGLCPEYAAGCIEEHTDGNAGCMTVGVEGDGRHYCFPVGLLRVWAAAAAAADSAGEQPGLEYASEDGVVVPAPEGNDAAGLEESPVGAVSAEAAGADALLHLCMSDN